MSAPPPASAIPRDIKHHSIALTTKAEASIHYSFVCGQGVIGQTCLVVFLNGLMMPKASWLPVMGSIVRQRKGMGCPSMLAYDRYGQGMTEDRDPQDEGRKEGYGHDCLDAAQDLHQLIVQIADIELQTKLADLQLVFVANSIGCAIARLYAQGYPATVDGILMLDSIMANSNFDFWPNPDAENFKQELLPEDVSIDILREQRAKFAAIFSPSIVNREGLNRRSLAKLLPRSDGPKLLGTKLPPLVTVVGHDFDAFAQESLKVSAAQLQLRR